MTTEALQDIINKRAEAKLENDLKFLSQLYKMDNYKYNKIFENVIINIGTSDKIDNTRAIHIFKENGRIYKEAFANNIDRYIKEETYLFLREIEDLKARVETLEGDIQNKFQY